MNNHWIWGIFSIRPMPSLAIWCHWFLVRDNSELKPENEFSRSEGNSFQQKANSWSDSQNKTFDLVDNLKHWQYLSLPFIWTIVDCSGEEQGRHNKKRRLIKRYFLIESAAVLKFLKSLIVELENALLCKFWSWKLHQWMIRCWQSPPAPSLGLGLDTIQTSSPLAATAAAAAATAAVAATPNNIFVWLYMWSVDCQHDDWAMESEIINMTILQVLRRLSRIRLVRIRY